MPSAAAPPGNQSRGAYRSTRMPDELGRPAGGRSRSQQRIVEELQRLASSGADDPQSGPPFNANSIMPAASVITASDAWAYAGGGKAPGGVGPLSPIISQGIELPVAPDSNCLRHV